jgi:hypothetical protein
MPIIFALALLALAAGCAARTDPIVGCAREGALEPVCGFENPEDLALLPDGRTVLVSQMAVDGMGGSGRGSLARFRRGEAGPDALFPQGDAATPDAAAAPGWGDPACPGGPGEEFAPHGIDLVRRPDGALALWVVNHGGRESLELFQVDPARATLAWRGCVIPPEGSFLNDVAGLPQGGFVATHMFRRGGTLRQLWSSLRGLLGADTGYVLEWQPTSGFRELEGSAGAMPNGIAVSPDGRYVYENVYLSGQVRRIPRDGQGEVKVAAIPSPDNITWSRDGTRLLVASHTGGFREMLGCGNIEHGTCPARFEIVSLHPDTMETQVILRHGGAPMGAVTVALDLGDALLLGTFRGDRVAYAHLPPR